MGTAFFTRINNNCANCVSSCVKVWWITIFMSRQYDETKTNRPNFVQHVTVDRNYTAWTKKKAGRTNWTTSIFNCLVQLDEKDLGLIDKQLASFYIVIVSGLNPTCVSFQHFCLFVFSKNQNQNWKSNERTTKAWEKPRSATPCVLLNKEPNWAHSLPFRNDYRHSFQRDSLEVSNNHYTFSEGSKIKIISDLVNIIDFFYKNLFIQKHSV